MMKFIKKHFKTVIVVKSVSYCFIQLTLNSTSLFDSIVGLFFTNDIV